MIAAVILAGASALAQAPARDTTPPPAAGTAIIRGRVLAAGVNEHPLSRVEVRAVCTSLKVDKAALTDANGRYEIGDLPACRYTVGFSRNNYVRASYGERRPLGPGAAIDVASGQAVSRIDAVLQRGGVVTGRVLDEFGDPITGAQVMLMRWAFVAGERRLQRAGQSANTNDLGDYRIYGITPGQYFISATSRMSGFGDTSDRSSYVPTYYPGTTNTAEAQRLTILQGQTIAGINMTLLPIVASKVSGVAVDAQARPMTNANVMLMQRPGKMFQASTQVRPDGTFAFGAVPPGDYTLRASGPAGADDSAQADISVTTGDMSGVQLVATKPSILRGRVVFEPGDVKAPAPTAITIIVTGAMTARSGNPDRDSAFEIKASAGTTRIRATVFGTGDWTLTRVLTANGTNVIDTGLDVPASATIDGLVLEMTSRHSEVTGTVVDAAGAHVRDCVVVVFAQDAERWTAQTRYFAVSRPNADEVFTARVPPGDYYVAAFEDADVQASWNDPEILQQLRERATKFSIAKGGKYTLEVPLGPPPVY